MHKKIKFELDEIEKELKGYNELLQKIKKEPPNKIEKAALATILHSFYTGLEKIFILIAKEELSYFPKGKNWHKDLLMKMNKEFMSNNLYDKLIGYLSFRHLFRNSYEFNLEWNEMKNLAININKVWNLFKKELKSYF